MLILILLLEGDIIKDETTFKVFMKNQSANVVINNTTTSTTTTTETSLKRKRSSENTTDTDSSAQYLCGELCKEMQSSMARNLSKRTVR